MFTTIDKAIVALIGAIVYFLAEFTPLDPGFLNEETVKNIAAVITPVLVWLIPNKEKK